MSKRSYVYWMTQRPPMPGAMPAYGLIEVVEFGERKWEPTIQREAWAKLTYNRELKSSEIRDYELTQAQYEINLTRAELYDLVGALNNDWQVNYELYIKLKDLLEG